MNIDNKTLLDLAILLKDIYTFDEFVEFGKKNADTLVKGMPWHFDFMGHPVTHENDECYLIPLANAETLRFTPNDILILENDNSVKIQRIPELTKREMLIAKYQALWFTKEIHSIKELLNKFYDEINNKERK